MHPIVVQEYALFETRRRLQEAEERRLARRARANHPSRARQAWQQMVAALRGRRGRSVADQRTAAEAVATRRPIAEARPADASARPQSPEFPAQRQAPDVQDIQRHLALTAGRH